MQTGTPAIPAYYAALPGLRSAGIDWHRPVRTTSVQLTRRLLSLVDRHGFSTVASRDPARLAGTVAVDVPDARHVARTLNARDIVVDYRPGVGIRIAPHVYNTTEEVDSAMAAMAEIVRTKDYVPETTPTVVTRRPDNDGANDGAKDTTVCGHAASLGLRARSRDCVRSFCTPRRRSDQRWRLSDTNRQLVPTRNRVVP